MATWVAVSACRAFTLGAETFRVLLAAEPGLREHVLRYLAGQVCQARTALAGTTAGTPAARGGPLAYRCEQLSNHAAGALASRATGQCRGAGALPGHGEPGPCNSSSALAPSAPPRAVILLDPGRLVSAES